MREMIDKFYSRCNLRSDHQLQEIIQYPDKAPIIESLLSMAFELIERRRVHGPLGCDWLAKPQMKLTYVDKTMLNDYEIEMLSQGKMILCFRSIRERTGMSLRETKDYFDKACGRESDQG